MEPFNSLLNTHSLHTHRLNHLRLSAVCSIPRHQTSARRACDSLAIYFSTHSTFPMQIWRHPAVHQKRYARHSLLSPTHPPTQAPDWVAALRYMTPLFWSQTTPYPPTPLHLTSSERHKPGNGCLEMLTPADFLFRWRGSLHRVEADKQASARGKYGGVQLCI